MAWFLLLLGLGGVAVASRFVAGQWDRERIAAEVEARGGTVESIEWAPLGHGFLGERGERIYEVAWRDRKGRRQQGTCKTSLLSGIYWHGDGLAGREVGAQAEAEQEMARLRKENARLKRQLGKRP